VLQSPPAHHIQQAPAAQYLQHPTLVQGRQISQVSSGYSQQVPTYTSNYSQVPTYSTHIGAQPAYNVHGQVGHQYHTVPQTTPIFNTARLSP
jgi:hypothetical protein